MALCNTNSLGKTSEFRNVIFQRVPVCKPDRNEYSMAGISNYISCTPLEFYLLVTNYFNPYKISLNSVV